MAREVDERIVEMRFENAQFQRNIKKTIESLDRLNETLEFEQASRGFDNLQKEVNGFSWDRFASGIDMIGDKFNNFIYIVENTLKHKVADKLVNWTEGMVKGLSVDQVSAGFGKYAEKVEAVQTIMNSTGLSIEKVNEYLEELMWYSDETSYSFTEMTKALGTFTSNGADIQDVIPMLEGIANATAHAGKGAAAFQSSLLNLGQSYGAGYLQSIDVKSLENQSVMTKKLKEIFIEEAKKLGTLDESGKTSKGNTVTTGTFRDTLKDQWATTEVMKAAYGRYAEFTQAVRKAVKDGTYSSATKAIEAMGGSYEGIGKDAFKAAQEAKTFKEVVDATKDSVSSGFLQIFETIFGDYKEATEMWTDLVDRFYDFFAAPIADKIDFFGEWKNEDGRINMIMAFQNAWDLLVDTIETFKEVWQDLFPPMTGTRLAEITAKIQIFFQNLQITNEVSDVFGNKTKELNEKGLKVKKIFEGVADVFGIFSDILKVLWKDVKRVGVALTPFASKTFDFFLALSDKIKSFRNYLNANGVIENLLEPIISGIERVLYYMEPLIAGGLQDILFFLDDLGRVLSNIGKLNPVKPQVLSILLGVFTELGSVIKEIAVDVWDAITSTNVPKGVEQMGNFFVAVIDFLGSILEKAQGILETYVIPKLDRIYNDFIIGDGKFVAIAAIVIFILSKFVSRILFVGRFIDFVKDVVENFGGFLINIKRKITGMIGFVVFALLGILISLRLVLKSISEIADLNATNQEGLRVALAAIASIFGVIALYIGIMKVLASRCDDMSDVETNISDIGKIFIGIGAGLYLIANAVQILADLVRDNQEGFDIAFVFIALIVGLLFAVGTILSKIGHSYGSYNARFANIAFTMVGIGASMILIAKAMRVMASIPAEELVTAGLIVLAVIFSFFFGLSRFAEAGVGLNKKALFSITIAILAIGKTMQTLTKSIEEFEYMDPVAVMMALGFFGYVFLMMQKLIESMTVVDTKKALIGILGIVTIAASFEIFSFSIGELLKTFSDCGIESGPIKETFGILAIFVGMIVGFLKLAETIKDVAKVQLMIGEIAAISFSFLAFTVALQMLSDSDNGIDWVKVALVFGGFIAFLAILQKVMSMGAASVQISKDLIKITAGLLLLSFAFAVFSHAVNSLDSDINWRGVLATCAGFIGIMIVLAKLVWMAPTMKTTIKFTAEMMLIAIALKTMIWSLKSLGDKKIDSDQIMAIMFSYIILLSAVLGLMHIPIKAQNIAGMIVIMAAIAGLFTGFVFLWNYAKDIEGIGGALLAAAAFIAGFFVVFCIITKILAKNSKDIFVASASMAMVAGVIAALVGMMTLFSLVLSYEGIGGMLAGLITMVILIAEIAIVLGTLSSNSENAGNMIVVALGFVIMAGAIVVLAGALAILTLLDVGKMFAAVGAIAALILVMSLATGILASFPQVIAFLGVLTGVLGSVASVLLGVAAAALGFASVLLVVGLTGKMLAQAFDSVVTTLKRMSEKIDPKALTSVFGPIVGFLSLIIILAGTLGVAATPALFGLAAAFIALGFAATMFAALIQTLKMFIWTVKQFDTEIDPPKFYSLGYSVGGEFIRGLGDGFVDTLTRWIANAIVSLGDGFKMIGENVKKGWNAIFGGGKNEENLGRQSMEKYLHGLEKEGEINSPSKATMRIAGYLTEGFAIGIQNGDKEVEEESRGLMDNVLGIFGNNDITDGLVNSFASLYDAMQNAPSDGLTLRPVLDMGGIEEDIASFSANTSDSLAMKAAMNMKENEDLTIHHTFDTPLTVEGINDKGQLVEVMNFELEDLIGKIVEKQRRM